MTGVYLSDCHLVSQVVKIPGNLSQVLFCLEKRFSMIYPPDLKSHYTCSQFFLSRTSASSRVYSSITFAPSHKQTLSVGGTLKENWCKVRLQSRKMLQMIKLPWLWRTPALTAETGSPLSPQPEESDHWGQLKVSCYTESDFIHLLLFSQLGDHC